MFAPRPRDPEFGAAHRLAGRFNVMFTGNLGPAQALDAVIDAAALLQDLPDVQFVFVGDGLSLPGLRQQAERLGLNNVRFIERQPIERMAEFLAWGDVLLFHLRVQPLHDITIPSKLYHYMASARPLLCAALGDSADIVRETNSGVLCKPQDAADIARGVRELRAMSPQQRADLGATARRAFEERFSRAVLLGKYRALFEQVLDDRRKERR
jgi:glycosyltransferase involved in cell wall biosynthesis